MLIHKVSRFLPSSIISSCHLKNVSDVVENSSLIFSQSLHEEIISPPKNPNKKHIHNTKVHYTKGFSPNDNITNEGRRCPPVTPISSVVDSSSHLKRRPKQSKVSNSSSASNGGGWFSSEEGENDTFFSLSSGTSSRSFNRLKTTKRWDDKSSEMGRCFSDMSASSVLTKPRDFRPKTDNVTGKPPRKDQKTAKTHRKSTMSSRLRNESPHHLEVVDNDVGFDYYSDFSSNHRKTSKQGRKKRANRRQRKGNKTAMVSSEIGYDAIEKSTNDPYNDFRASMVEMIVKKQIFGEEDLKRLLHCFLSLNSSCFHHIIIEVFTEIIETLFGQ